MEKVIILDYSDCSVHFYSYIPNEESNIEDLIESWGFNLDNIEWMSGEDMTIKFHKERLNEAVH